MSKPNKFVRPSRISIPIHAHPLSRLIFQLMRDRGVSYSEFEWRSGVLVQTLKSWRREKVGSLRSYEAALGVFGYRILPVPPIDNLPADVLEKLEEVGQHFISDDETLAAAIYAATSQPVQHEGRAPRIDYKSVDWLEAAE